jgi:hypothetical protein
LNGTLAKLNVPELLVLVDRTKPLTGFLISTVALGTTAPVGSTTVPLMDVELPLDCALASKPSPKQSTTISIARNKRQ